MLQRCACSPPSAALLSPCARSSPVAVRLLCCAYCSSPSAPTCACGPPVAALLLPCARGSPALLSCTCSSPGALGLPSRASTLLVAAPMPGCACGLPSAAPPCGCSPAALLLCCTRNPPCAAPCARNSPGEAMRLGLACRSSLHALAVMPAIPPFDELALVLGSPLDSEAASRSNSSTTSPISASTSIPIMSTRAMRAPGTVDVSVGDRFRWSTRSPSRSGGRR